MIAQINNGLFLMSEDREFKGRDGKDVNYHKAKILDDQNEVHELTVDKELVDPLVSNFHPRQEIACTIEISEREGNNGKYLQKRLIGIG